MKHIDPNANLKVTLNKEKLTFIEKQKVQANSRPRNGEQRNLCKFRETGSSVGQLDDEFPQVVRTEVHVGHGDP